MKNNNFSVTVTCINLYFICNAMMKPIRKTICALNSYNDPQENNKYSKEIQISNRIEIIRIEI